MCGRFNQLAPAAELGEYVGIDDPGEAAPALAEPSGPRYNVAPTDDAAVCLLERGKRRLAMLRWGFGARGPRRTPLINARSETAATRPTFRRAFERRRCLIPVDGFYEWARGIGPAQPWLIRMREGRLFALAGLWEEQRPPVGTGAARAFTVLTTVANARLAPIHDRMPVIVPRESLGGWLAGGPLPPAFPAAEMEAYPVSRFVNDPRRKGPECAAPLTAAELRRSRPPSLFGVG